MSTLLGIGLLSAGPVLGALCAIALGATQIWQVVIAAGLGEGVAVAVGRAWSARSVARTKTGTPLVTGEGAGRPTNVVIRATGLTWRDHLLTFAVFSGFAALVGALAATEWRIVIPGH